MKKTNLLRKISVNEVFTPTKEATYNYLEREKLIKDFRHSLSIQGKPIIVYGHTGSGKTTLVRTELRKMEKKFIRTQCSTITTYEEMILNVFDQLNVYYTSACNTSISSEISGRFMEAKALMNSTQYLQENRIVPPQITSQALARILGEADHIWMIEDFHKVSLNEKQKIADALKIFIDESNDFPEVKIICIGAVASSRQLLELDDNLSYRTSDLHVPLLSDDEIEQIVRNGFKLLNTKISDNLVTRILYYSNNIGAVAHQICFNLCSENNISQKKIFSTQTIKNISMDNAVESFVLINSDTYKKLYDKICSYESLGKVVLKLFARYDLEGVHNDVILRQLGNKNPSKIKEISLFLTHLTSGKYAEALRYDENSKCYCISNPFFLVFIKMQLDIEKNQRNRKKEVISNREYEIDFSSERYINEYMERMLKLIERLEQAPRKIYLNSLTTLEVEVLKKVLDNKTYYSIAMEMDKSESLIKMTMQKIYTKLRIRGRRELLDLYENNRLELV